MEAAGLDFQKKIIEFGRILVFGKQTPLCFPTVGVDFAVRGDFQWKIIELGRILIFGKQPPSLVGAWLETGWSLVETWLKPG